jgi:glycosyltransferase involved in cell wall biosynthesis
VLTEALALGLPVVSTDCPSGPRELLEDGRFGALVPVGDSEAMAAGISGILDGRVAFDNAELAVRDYHAHVSARYYLEALGLV